MPPRRRLPGHLCRAAIAWTLVTAVLGPGRAAGQTAAPPATPPAAPAATPVLPSWLQVHAEHRTRYESVDVRYRANETGGDQAFNFRTRLQVRLTAPRAFGYAEIQDSRIALNDSASTVGISQVLNTHVLQLHGGFTWKTLGRRTLGVQIEGGRFSRDFGFRRVISRSIYRNTTNAFDGVIGRVGVRVFGQFEPGRHAEYEVESAVQRGEVGPLDHRASFAHLQAGYAWTSGWRPRLLARYDYASGDADPADGLEVKY